MKTTTGDLFDFAGTHAIAHGVNCVGVMGGGIAAQFARRYPKMKQFYQYACRNRALHPGGMIPWHEELEDDNYHVILNCASQYLPGPDARLDALTNSLFLAAAYASAQGVPLAIPEIGCGIGGLDPTEAYRCFESVGDVVDLTVVRYG